MSYLPKLRVFGFAMVCGGALLLTRPGTLPLLVANMMLIMGGLCSLFYILLRREEAKQ